MPELPEVETMRRGVLPIVGSRIQAVRFPRCRLKPIQVGPSRAGLARRVRGRAVVDVSRLGKRVLLELDSDDVLVFEPRMTGLVLLTDPPNTTHLRMHLDLKGRAAEQLTYWDRRGLGRVYVWSPAEREAGARQFGPDALTITLDAFCEALGTTSRPVKVALLDQQRIAGVGNLYASEMLHAAGVHPELPGQDLSRRQCQGLRRAMRRILNDAIRYEGSTLADGTYRNALNRDGSYQNHHRVYQKADTPCPSCRVATIVRIVQAQRATFFCPACQPLSG